MPCVSNRLRKIPNFCTGFVLPNPARRKMYGGCHGLRKSFAQLLKIRREELWTVQEVQVSLLAPVEQKQRAVQEVDNDAVAGNRDQNGTEARTGTRTGIPRCRTNQESRTHHHRVGGRLYLGDMAQRDLLPKRRKSLSPNSGRAENEQHTISPLPCFALSH